MADEKKRSKRHDETGSEMLIPDDEDDYDETGSEKLVKDNEDNDETGRERLIKADEEEEEDDEEKPSKHPDEEQGIIDKKHGADKAQEMEIGEKDEDVYDETGREKLVEDAEIEPREEGFSEGYEGRGKHSTCAACGKVLDEDSTMEREIEGELMWFCSDSCAENYSK